MNNKLRQELRELLNRHSRENRSDTPNFILADYMMGCLTMFENVVQRREKWHGRNKPEVPSRLKERPTGP